MLTHLMPKIEPHWLKNQEGWSYYLLLHSLSAYSQWTPLLAQQTHATYRELCFAFRLYSRMPHAHIRNLLGRYSPDGNRLRQVQPPLLSGPASKKLQLYLYIVVCYYIDFLYKIGLLYMPPCDSSHHLISDYLNFEIIIKFEYFTFDFDILYFQ